MNADLGLSTDPASARPLYRQIVDQVSARIHEGTLPAGFRLPATRALAQALGTNRSTVVAAFRELAEGGLLVSTVGRGTFVADRPAVTPRRPTTSRELSWASLVSNTTRTGILHELDRLGRRVAGGDHINLQRMEPSSDLLPLDAFRRCVQHVMRTRGGVALGYAPREGLARLRGAIAEDLARRGVPTHAENILVTTGSQQALDLVARILVDPGETILVQDATYTGAIHVLSAAGARVVGVPNDDEGPDIDALERLGRSGAKGLYVMPGGQNPTGRTISAARREHLVAWSHHHGIPLIEDDYCADLELDSVTLPPALRTLDSQVLHVGTFSKRLIPALRIGYLVCPPALRQHLTVLKHAMDLGSSLLLQHALAEFLERGYLRTHLTRILAEYRRRRDTLEAGLTRHMPRSVRWTRATRGLTTWLTLPPGVDSEEIFDAALDRGVVVAPDVLFSVDGQERGLRLTFCREPPRRLAEGAKRLGLAMRAVMRRNDVAPGSGLGPV
ncbi:MAG: PLP-dependent aminotransferase family protein [Deltaproteobacteria bacterium]|nr:PLP-dependent aminotransferase family protein [Deltaproteobacteria bacterium]